MERICCRTSSRCCPLFFSDQVNMYIYNWLANMGILIILTLTCGSRNTIILVCVCPCQSRELCPVIRNRVIRFALIRKNITRWLEKIRHRCSNASYIAISPAPSFEPYTNQLTSHTASCFSLSSYPASHAWLLPRGLERDKYYVNTCWVTRLSVMMYMLWFKFIFCLNFFKPVWFLFSFVSDYGNEY